MARPHCTALLQAQSAPWARARGRRGPVRPAAAQHHRWQGHPSGNVRGPGGRCPTEDLRGLPHRARVTAPSVTSRQGGIKEKGQVERVSNPSLTQAWRGRGPALVFFWFRVFRGPLPVRPPSQ